MKYAWIKKSENTYPIKILCRTLRVSRSGYYRWCQSAPSARALENKRLSEKIKALFYMSRCLYGTRRIRHLLQQEGEIISRRRIGKIMKDQGLRCKTRRRYCLTTTSNHRQEIAPNLLNRKFVAASVNQKYVGDITYIRTLEGWLYLAVVIDLFSRRVVGWSLSSRMDAGLVNRALQMAIDRRQPPPDLLWHTDRGSQYASDSHRLILKKYGITQSMSRKGNCWDNAVSESFFHTLKTELTKSVTFTSRRQAKAAIFEYIEVYYNKQRLHSSNDYMAPAVFEEVSKNK